MAVGPCVLHSPVQSTFAYWIGGSSRLNYCPMPATPRRAAVIGAGPNGLAAAIVLAQAGLQVDVFEAEAQPGGAARTLELTLPGFLHDFGSAVHPMAAGSPFFYSLPLRCDEPAIPRVPPVVWSSVPTGGGGRIFFFAVLFRPARGVLVPPRRAPRKGSE